MEMQSSSGNGVEEVGGSSNKKENVLPPMAGGNPNKKTLVLDLDGTLVHTSLMPMPLGYHFTINVSVQGCDKPLYVVKRPGVDQLLLQLGSTGLYEIVIFTASHKAYADAVLDKILDSLPSNSQGRNLIPPTHRITRNYCTKIRVKGEPQKVKDLSILGRDLKKVIIVDDREMSFLLQPQNGILVDCWTGQQVRDADLFHVLSFCLKIEDPKLPYSATEDVRELIQELIYDQLSD